MCICVLYNVCNTADVRVNLTPRRVLWTKIDKQRSGSGPMPPVTLKYTYTIPYILVRPQQKEHSYQQRT